MFTLLPESTVHYFRTFESEVPSVVPVGIQTKFVWRRNVLGYYNSVTWTISSNPPFIDGNTLEIFSWSIMWKIFSLF